MLRLNNLEYDSWQTVYFQRLSVIVTELLLVYALHLYVSSSPQPTKHASHVAALSILLSPGLLIIDHIHFQYNGFMYGLLLFSLVLARHESTILLSGALFAALLCFKHIYLYLAPAYFVYLLRKYCLGNDSIFHLRLTNCIKLGSAVVAIFAVALGPFLYHGQTEQLLKRLFPFSRGLCHAYWAPNVWAVYSFVDRALILGKFTPRLSTPPTDPLQLGPPWVYQSTSLQSTVSLVDWLVIHPLQYLPTSVQERPSFSRSSFSS